MQTASADRTLALFAEVGGHVAGEASVAVGVHRAAAAIGQHHAGIAEVTGGRGAAVGVHVALNAGTQRVAVGAAVDAGAVAIDDAD